MTPDRKLEWDWYAGRVPENVVLDDTAYCETTFSFRFLRSELPEAVRYGRGASTYLGTMFDLGPRGRVTLGEFTLVHGARIICDSEITIGDYTMVSWNVVFMDTYRVPLAALDRRAELARVPARSFRVAAAEVPARPIRIGSNVWIGFEACILPGVTVGSGAVIGARSVVANDVPPYAIAAGNPAAVIRQLDMPDASPTMTPPR